MEDTHFLDEIKTTLSYSGEISHSLFSDMLGKSFQGITEHYHTIVSRQSVVKLSIFMKMLNRLTRPKKG